VGEGLGTSGGGDRLPGAAAFSVVGDAPGVGTEVAVELAYRFAQFGLFTAGCHGIQGHGDVLDGLQGAEDVAVPEKPRQPLQLGADLGGGVGRRCGRELRIRRRWGQGLDHVGHDGDSHGDVEPVEQVLDLRVEVTGQVTFLTAVGEERDLLVGRHALGGEDWSVPDFIDTGLGCQVLGSNGRSDRQLF
jgi:hypothetical protein